MKEHPIVVVKVGSSSLTDESGRLSTERIDRIARGLVAAADRGVQPILVSSGAIAAGRGKQIHARTKRDVTELQALAAVGQSVLMATYAEVFSRYRKEIAQVLLTAYEFGERTAYLNTRATLERLCSWGVIPIINENDTTATQEISLGENDRLSALVATLLKARLLIILTDTEGVFEVDPRLQEDAALIEEIVQVDREIEQLGGGPTTSVGSGGMATKLAAAKIASWSGIPCVIASAEESDVIPRVWSGEQVGTRIHPKSERMSSRKVWIAFAHTRVGSLVIDEGAQRAISGSGASLLSVGIREVNGEFGAGGVVDICAIDRTVIAKGISRFASGQLRDQPGSELGVIVHRDDLVINS